MSSTGLNNVETCLTEQKSQRQGGLQSCLSLVAGYFVSVLTSTGPSSILGCLPCWLNKVGVLDIFSYSIRSSLWLSLSALGAARPRCMDYMTGHPYLLTSAWIPPVERPFRKLSIEKRMKLRYLLMYLWGQHVLITFFHQEIKIS